jgi:hypothetical protein
MLFCECLSVGPSIFGFSPPLPEEGQFQADPAPTNSKAPEADEGQDGDDAKDYQEDSGSTSSPPLPTLKRKVWRGKGSVLTT